MQPQNQRHLRDIPIVILTAILTATSVLLGVFAPYAAMMGAIGVADLRISGGGSSYFLTHSSDFLVPGCQASARWRPAFVGSQFADPERGSSCRAPSSRVRSSG